MSILQVAEPSWGVQDEREEWAVPGSAPQGQLSRLGLRPGLQALRRAASWTNAQQRTAPVLLLVDEFTRKLRAEKMVLFMFL